MHGSIDGQMWNMLDCHCIESLLCSQLGVGLVHQGAHICMHTGAH